MKIVLENIGKKYNKDWIFQGLDLTIESGNCFGITGGNGSGKSTMLQMLAGYSTPSAGRITWKLGEQPIEVTKIFEYISWCTPQVALYDEFSLQENIEFFLKFKKVRDQLSMKSIVEELRLESYQHRLLRHYSSGMRQRVKLGFAILADTPLLLLDEPVSHLDAVNTQWFQQLLTKHRERRSIFIASNNNSDELFLADQRIVMDQYKR